MRKYLLCSGCITYILLLMATNSYGQRYISDSSYVYFFSEAPMETIEAENTEGSSVIDLGEGKMVFAVPIKGFQFEKSLMQEHFNENYLESDKYPRTTFTGSIEDWDRDMLSDSVTVSGTFTIHGVSREVSVKGKVYDHETAPYLEAKFPIQIVDYDIKIPKIVFYNIAEVVDITVYFRYKPYEN